MKTTDELREPYEAPKLETVGTVRDLTMGSWGFGDADSLVFTIKGHEVEITYGLS